MNLGELLLFTKQSGASDLYLSAAAPLMIRVHGDVRKLSAPGVPLDGLAAQEVQRMLYEILNDVQRLRLEEHLELDLSVDLKGVGRFRANAFFHDRGLGAIFRVIPGDIPTIEGLALPDVLRSLCARPSGLVLMTGPTGSGKSTTLAAMVDHINETTEGHIITIEDPIEFVHRPKRCMVHQRELGPNTQSFDSALRSALREDPDVILVGEMRDLETISLALTAAETGHLVLATLHTSSASTTVDRIICAYPLGQQAQVRTMLAGSLQGIVAQILLSRLDPPGRVAAHEICIATHAVRAMIRDDRAHQIPTAIQTGGRVGMQTLSNAIIALSTAGKISRKTSHEAQVEYCGAEGSEVHFPGATPASGLDAETTLAAGGVSGHMPRMPHGSQ